MLSFLSLYTEILHHSQNGALHITQCRISPDAAGERGENMGERFDLSFLHLAPTQRVQKETMRAEMNPFNDNAIIISIKTPEVMTKWSLIGKKEMTTGRDTFELAPHSSSI